MHSAQVVVPTPGPFTRNRDRGWCTTWKSGGATERASALRFTTCLLLFLAVANLATLLSRADDLPLFFVFLAIFSSAAGFALAEGVVFLGTRVR